jgi:Fe-S-cluster containining protein
MGGACSIYGERKNICRVFWGNLEERDHLEDPDVDFGT